MLRLKDANIGSVAFKKPRSSTVFKYPSGSADTAMTAP
jgi:hypothetical protein